MAIKQKIKAAIRAFPATMSAIDQGLKDALMAGVIIVCMLPFLPIIAACVMLANWAEKED